VIFGLSKTFARLVRGTITVPTTTRQEAGGVRCVIRPLCPFEPGKDDILWLLQFHHIAAQRADELRLEFLRRQPKRARVEIRRSVSADLATAIACNLPAPLAIAKPLSRAS
jgi:hypothetical protein